MKGELVDYRKGLQEVGDGIHAYLQPDGGWGWSNAGLVVADGASLLVDTLFDLKLTTEMLSSMKPLTDSDPISTVVNTHANGDHCYGNQLVAGPGCRILATEAAAAEMSAVSPSMIQALMAADLGDSTNRYIREAFAPFEFDGIETAIPDQTFSGELLVEVGGREVSLLEVGPAHTAGDLIVHVPDASTVFCGDILFIGGTPIIWEGPLANWVTACDRILELGCGIVVPGHGPVTDASGVREVRDYLVFVDEASRQRHAAGMSAEDAVSDLDLGQFAEWGEWERIAVNVRAVYRELDGGDLSPIELFAAMATLKYPN